MLSPPMNLSALYDPGWWHWTATLPLLALNLIEGYRDSLDSETCLVTEFARAALDDLPEQERLSSEVRAAFGERALVEISLAIATPRVFPTLKRSLGSGVSCRAISVQVRPNPERRSA